MPRLKKTRASIRRNSIPMTLMNSTAFRAALRQEAANGALDALRKAGLLAGAPGPLALTPLRRAIIFKLAKTPGMGLSAAEIADAVYRDPAEVTRIIGSPYPGDILEDIQDGTLTATKAAIIRHLLPLFKGRTPALAAGVGVNPGRVSETSKGRAYGTVSAADRFEDEDGLEARSERSPSRRYSEGLRVH